MLLAGCFVGYAASRMFRAEEVAVVPAADTAEPAAGYYSESP